MFLRFEKGSGDLQVGEYVRESSFDDPLLVGQKVGRLSAYHSNRVAERVTHPVNEELARTLSAGRSDEASHRRSARIHVVGLAIAVTHEAAAAVSVRAKVHDVPAWKTLPNPGLLFTQHARVEAGLVASEWYDRLIAVSDQVDAKAHRLRSRVAELA